MRPLGPNRIIWLVHRFTFDQQPYFYSLSFLFLIIIVNSFNLHKQLPFQFSCKNSHSHYIFCNLRKMKSCPFFLHYLPLSPVKHFLSHTQPSPWHLSNRAQLSSLAISPFQRGHCPLISSSCTSSAVIFPQLETGCYLSCSFFFFSHLPSHPCCCLYSWKQLAPKLAFLLWALLVLGHMNVTCSLLLVEELCFVLADHKSSCDVWSVNLSPCAEHFTLTHISFHILSPVGQIPTANMWRHQRVPSCVSKVRNEDFKQLWER